MHPVWIGFIILGATFAAALLPGIFWPNWPSQLFFGLGLIAGAILFLVDGLKTGEFDTNHGLFRRDERPVGFYANAAILVAIICAVATGVVVKAMEWFAAQ